MSEEFRKSFCIICGEFKNEPAIEKIYCNACSESHRSRRRRSVTPVCEGDANYDNLIDMERPSFFTHSDIPPNQNENLHFLEELKNRDQFWKDFPIINGLINGYDLESLSALNGLTGQVIDFSFGWISTRNKKIGTISHYMTQIVEKGGIMPTNCYYWTMQEVDFIYVPGFVAYTIGNHWFFIVYDLRSNFCLIFDSINELNEQENNIDHNNKKIAQYYLEKLIIPKANQDGYKFHRMWQFKKIVTPRQELNGNCGAFCILSAICFAKNVGKDINLTSTFRNLFNEKHMPFIRRLVTAIILHYHKKSSSNMAPVYQSIRKQRYYYLTMLITLLEAQRSPIETVLSGHCSAELVEMSNKGARLNVFTDAGAQWRAVYVLPWQFGFFLECQFDILCTQIASLYEQLMAYFHSKLASIHSKKSNEDNQKAGQISRDRLLPLNLLKSLNDDSWSAYCELTKPFGEEMTAKELKIVNELVDAFQAQNYAIRVMFAKVFRFMKYVGFEQLSKSFWMNSIFTLNWAKDMICNPPIAYNMMDGNDDYRAIICGQLNKQEFLYAHRLMTKLFYQNGSRKQLILLWDAPNLRLQIFQFSIIISPNIFSLSSSLAVVFGILSLNPEYLTANKFIGPQTEQNESAEINRLYKEALEEIVKLPLAIVADKWRYAVFEGKLNASNCSQEWWTLRQKYQGIQTTSMAKPKAIEYDAVSSSAITQFHAPAIRDAIVYIAKLQVLKKLCGGIDRISQGCLPTKNAFESVLEAISQGGSIPWINAFEKLTGNRQLDARPMLEYFESLVEWLKNTNKNEQRILGWPNPKGDPFTENELLELHNEYQNENQNQQWAGWDSGLSLSSDGSGERIVFPGQECVKGQECLLDSQCNGTICFCREGIFTYKIADSYNCGAGDPAKIGITDDNGGLVIKLNDRDKAGDDGNSTSHSTNEENGSEMPSSKGGEKYAAGQQ